MNMKEFSELHKGLYAEYQNIVAINNFVTDERLPAIFKKYNGKKYTKRVITELKKVADLHNVYIDTDDRYCFGFQFKVYINLWTKHAYKKANASNNSFVLVHNTDQDHLNDIREFRSCQALEQLERFKKNLNDEIAKCENAIKHYDDLAKEYQNKIQEIDQWFDNFHKDACFIFGGFEYRRLHHYSTQEFYKGSYYLN